MLRIVQQWVSDVTGALPEVPSPKFTVPTWPIDPLDPWKGTGTNNNSDFWQMYVTRGMEDVPTVVEVVPCRCRHEEDHGSHCPIVGHCFDLRGNLIDLSREEEADARNGWQSWNEAQE